MPALAPDNQATPEQLEDVVLAARYGEIDEVTQFIDQFSASALLEAIDDNGNTTLHMSAANGHAEIIKLILDGTNDSLVGRANNAGSTALHWAALNGRLDVVRMLVPRMSPEQIAATNVTGKTAQELAENLATEKGYECAGYIEAQTPEVKTAEGVEEGDDEKITTNGLDDSADQAESPSTEADAKAQEALQNLTLESKQQTEQTQKKST